MNYLARFLTVLLASAVLGRAQDGANADTGARPVVVACGVGDHGQTIPIRSSAGFTVILNMHSDDDHSKNSHQCAAQYMLEITRRDGSCKYIQLLYSDDEWGRPLDFRVEGFSKDGSNVLILLIEGNYPQSLQATEFAMSAGHEVKSVMLNAQFTSRLSRDCAGTLHIVGTTPEDYIVLGTEARDGCVEVERWQLRQNKHVVRDGLTAEAANNPVGEDVRGSCIAHTSPE